MAVKDDADADVFGVDEAAVEDADAIGDLFYEDMTHLGVDADREALRELADSVVRGSQGDDPDCLCWVARIDADGPAVGVIVANFNWSLKFAGRALWIEELFVTPDERRQGLGRALVDRVVQYAETHDIHGIDLEAYQGNTPASVLYRTAGFHRLGRERFYRRTGEHEFL